MALAKCKLLCNSNCFLLLYLLSWLYSTLLVEWFSNRWYELSVLVIVSWFTAPRDSHIWLTLQLPRDLHRELACFTSDSEVSTIKECLKSIFVCSPRFSCCSSRTYIEICGEIPFPLAKRVAELSSPESSVHFPAQKITVFPAKL